MYCPNCGNELDEESTYCENCKGSSPVPVVNEWKRRQKLNMVGIIAGVVTLIAMFLPALQNERSFFEYSRSLMDLGFFESVCMFTLVVSLLVCIYYEKHIINVIMAAMTVVLAGIKLFTVWKIVYKSNGQFSSSFGGYVVLAGAVVMLVSVIVALKNEPDNK